MTDGKRRMEEGEETERGRGQKGRLIQERDRWGLAWVGMNRVVREKSLAEVLFPGRDAATFGNRVWELARDLKPAAKRLFAMFEFTPPVQQIQEFVQEIMPPRS